MSKLAEFTDEELVAWVRTKDKEAYGEIVRRYQDKLLRYAYYILGDSHQAADIVQESFVKAYVNLQGFNLKKKFSSWIYRIVHNEALKFISKHKRETGLFDNADFDSGVNIEREYTQKETAAMVRKCLGKIPILYREPLSLYYLEGNSYQEISDILRIPVGTVGTRINRAKKLMKKICQKEIK